ncbi:MAG: asparagine synthase (glutamine-hydrolyzing) [Candidatus Sericytochromatia bacterium]|nr:asparagine synthase (glutamine-hydrolyzing) [Candidatus Sericytochromatia bacterium]
MCGIAGIVRPGTRMPATLAKRMCDAIAYRGPDDVGYVAIDSESGRARAYSEAELARWAGPEGPDHRLDDDHAGATGDVLLGHRRLSIIDLSVGGHQPMASEDRQVWISYNGEIYNFAELRADLEAKGHHFLSHSDTEVLLRLYEDEGEAGIRRLNGIFAFAIWDGRQRKLILGRDRFGCKPLYYARVGDTLVFASEVKAILASGLIDARLHVPSLVEYFTFQNTWGSDTLFAGVKLLPAGTFLVSDADGMRQTTYWDWPEAEPDQRDFDVLRRELGDRLGDAITRQMISDVPVGTYLSGGVDSASITHFASRRTKRLMTFTGGFDVSRAIGLEASFDERQEAEIVAAQCGTEHYQMVIHSGDLVWALPRLTYHLEELRVGMSYPGYYIARLASKFVKVVLGGVGGDELFAGYPWRYQPVMALQGEAFDQANFRYWCRLIAPEDHVRAFTPEVLAVAGPAPYEHYKRVMGDRQFSDPLRRALYFEAKTFLHGLLVVEDKLSMAHGLEARVPLLDNDLVDFVATLPPGALLNADAAELNMSGKHIFREAMRSRLPEAIINKRKQGFSAPDQTWYRGPLNDYVRGLLLDKRTQDRGIFRPAYINEILTAHFTGKANHRLLIWSLISFEVWCRIFLDGQSPESISA